MGNPAMANTSNCWIAPVSSETTQSFRCKVVERTNANGDTVYDITHFQGSGAQFSVVLWTDGTAELFVNDIVANTTWYYDHDGDVRLDLGSNGEFIF